MRLKGLRSKWLLFHCLGPGGTDPLQQSGIVWWRPEAWGKALIDKIDVEAWITGKAAFSTANDPPDFGAAHRTATKQPEQSHLVFRDERRSNASLKRSALL
jgi:hypothetical protein